MKPCWNIVFCMTLTLVNGKQTSAKPHIIVIIGDDIGYNDVGFHGSSQIPTPNIDALAYNGIILNKFYTQSTCTPSRAAFLTGNYPLRSGLQGMPIIEGEDLYLPLDMPTMPEMLKKLGYSTHLVGKWHLGFSYRNNTPIRRGFDSHYGLWSGSCSYFGHNVTYKNSIEGLDFHDQFDNVWSADGKHTTDLLTTRAVQVIDNHKRHDPLFLIVSHAAPHTGRNNTEMEVPDANRAHSKYSYIKDPQRRLYADLLSSLDDSVGVIINKLIDKRMLENSIVFFFSDNGGASVAYTKNWASNWPLRGNKLTNFEAGVKGTGAIYSPLFAETGYINNELIHLTDFLPTFYEIAGGDTKNLGNIDGMNQRKTISHNQKTNRSFILVGIDEVANNSAIIDDNGKYKLVTGYHKYFPATPSPDSYYGDDGRGSEVPPYNFKAVLESRANIAISHFVNSPLTEKKIKEMRDKLDLSKCRREPLENVHCFEPHCLFDLQKDPCENTNLVKKKPEIADRLLKKIQRYYKDLKPQPPRGVIDPASNPKLFNNTWCTWLEPEWCLGNSRSFSRSKIV